MQQHCTCCHHGYTVSNSATAVQTALYSVTVQGQRWYQFETDLMKSALCHSSLSVTAVITTILDKFCQ